MKHNKRQQQSSRLVSGRLSTVFIVVLFLLTAPMLMAEEPMKFQFSENTSSQISDHELKEFGFALVEVQEIQVTANEEINTAVNDSELPVERLDEIFIMQQKEPERVEQEVQDDELEEFSMVMNAIASIQMEAEQEIVASLEQHNYTVESFNQMARTIQEDSELLNRLQLLLTNS
jgi:hypothetical protein